MMRIKIIIRKPPLSSSFIDRTEQYNNAAFVGKIVQSIMF